jgi:hypothetical protein
MYHLAEAANSQSIKHHLSIETGAAFLKETLPRSDAEVAAA